MSFYGRSNRMLIESELEKGLLRDCQIVECDLSGLEVKDLLWEEAELRDLHANDIRFAGTHIEKSTFTRCSAMRAGFLGATLLGTVLDGLTLIKSQWQNCKIERSHIKNSVLQRSRFNGCNITASSFVDFEGLNVEMNQCVIAHSMFGVSYGSGMNGLSGGSIRNCIFYNCVRWVSASGCGTRRMCFCILFWTDWRGHGLSKCCGTWTSRACTKNAD